MGEGLRLIRIGRRGLGLPAVLRTQPGVSRRMNRGVTGELPNSSVNQSNSRCGGDCTTVCDACDVLRAPDAGGRSLALGTAVDAVGLATVRQQYIGLLRAASWLANPATDLGDQSTFRLRRPELLFQRCLLSRPRMSRDAGVPGILQRRQQDRRQLILADPKRLREVHQRRAWFALQLTSHLVRPGVERIYDARRDRGSINGRRLDRWGQRCARGRRGSLLVGRIGPAGTAARANAGDHGDDDQAKRDRSDDGWATAIRSKSLGVHWDSSLPISGQCLDCDDGYKPRRRARDGWSSHLYS